MISADIVYAVKAQLANAEDNLWRAESAFRGLPPSKMAEEYGESGQSRQSILDGYRAASARWKAALATVST